MLNQFLLHFSVTPLRLRGDRGVTKRHSKIITPFRPPYLKRLSDNSKNPSPLAGEGKGEGVNLLIYNVFFTLPLSLPSREGNKMELSDSLLRELKTFTEQALPGYSFPLRKANSRTIICIGAPSPLLKGWEEGLVCGL